MSLVEEIFSNNFLNLYSNNIIDQEFNTTRFDIYKTRQTPVMVIFSIFYIGNLIGAFFTRNNVFIIFNSIILFFWIINVILNYRLNEYFILKCTYKFNLILILNLFFAFFSIHLLEITLREIFKFSILFFQIITAVFMFSSALIFRVLDLSFLRYLIGEALYLIFVWIFLLSLGNQTDYYQYDIVFSVISIIFIFWSYFNERYAKTWFFSDYLFKYKEKTNKDLIHNLNSGIIAFSKDNLIFHNKYVKDLLGLLLKPIHNHFNTAVEFDLNSIQVDFLKNFLSDEFKVNEVNDNRYKIILDKLKSIENLGALLREFESKNELFQNYTYLGVKSILNEEKNGEENKQYFEIFIRITRTFNNEFNFEFLLKDISRAKTIEEANAKIKYRTLFLSKAAHEFKNPIISIKELILQSKKNMSFLQRTDEVIKIEKDFDIIVNISDYMIILISDFQDLGELEIGKTVNLYKSQVCLYEIVKFCSNIAMTLINYKQNKISSDHNSNTKIEMLTELDDKLPDFIMTDEIKLKQILLNLLSNSIKFVKKGFIKLKISYKQKNKLKIGKFAKISIIDTGIGISESIKYNLFQEYNKIKSQDNILGSGLGLKIVQEMTKQLGTPIDYKSDKTKTKFFFYLEIDPSLENIKRKKFSSISLNDTVRLPFDIEISKVDMFSSIDINTKEIESKGKTMDDDNDKITIIITDDESLIRKSSARVVQEYFEKNNLKVEIIECEDGIECLNCVYHLNMLGRKINYLFIDETMKVLCGGNCSKLLHEFFDKGSIERFPIYLLTSYYNEEFIRNTISFNGIKKVISKPINMNVLQSLFNEN